MREFQTALGLVAAETGACSSRHEHRTAPARCHWGGTTQDIMDTADVLQMRAALDLVADDLDAVAEALAALAREHAELPMAGRTHLQHALPITFGIRGAMLMMQTETGELLEPFVRPRRLVGDAAEAQSDLVRDDAGGGQDRARAARRHARRDGAGPRARDRTVPCEWQAITTAFIVASAGFRAGARRSRGGRSGPMRCARVLGMSGGLIVAEAVMMGLAPVLGRQVAHDVVYDCCRAALARGTDLLEALEDDPRVCGHLDRQALERLVDPANYLGAAPEMTRRLLQNCRAEPVDLARGGSGSGRGDDR